MSASTGLCVQYGCGLSAPPGWRNFDASPTLLFERIPILGGLYQKNAHRFPEGVEYGDILRGLPLPPASARAVFASHVLEHLALDDMRVALRNTWSLLAPGGLFRMIVPDLEIAARRYLENASDDAAVAFIRDMGIGLERRSRGLLGLVHAAFGNSRHQWMWDYRSLVRELADAGFVGMRRASHGDSADMRFREVEDRGRFVDAVAIECTRPA